MGRGEFELLSRVLAGTLEHSAPPSIVSRKGLSRGWWGEEHGHCVISLTPKGFACLWGDVETEMSQGDQRKPKKKNADPKEMQDVFWSQYSKKGQSAHPRVEYI